MARQRRVCVSYSDLRFVERRMQRVVRLGLVLRRHLDRRTDRGGSDRQMAKASSTAVVRDPLDWRYRFHFTPFYLIACHPIAVQCAHGSARMAVHRGVTRPSASARCVCCVLVRLNPPLRPPRPPRARRRRAAAAASEGECNRASGRWQRRRREGCESESDSLDQSVGTRGQPTNTHHVILRADFNDTYSHQHPVRLWCRSNNDWTRYSQKKNCSSSLPLRAASLSLSRTNAHSFLSCS